MLLLVIDAQLDQLQRSAEGWAALVEARRRRCAPGSNVIKARSAEHAAPRPGVALTFAFIIAVEEVGPAFVVQAIAGDMIAQDEGFEEPGRVRQVPFRGRGIGMGLDGRIGIRQRCGEIERQHFLITARQSARPMALSSSKPPFTTLSNSKLFYSNTLVFLYGSVVFLLFLFFLGGGGGGGGGGGLFFWLRVYICLEVNLLQRFGKLLLIPQG